jgi:hypothetical protein
MLEYVVARLVEQDRFQKQGGIAVVPAVDIRQGGTLTVDSAPGAGTTVRMVVPR